MRTELTISTAIGCIIGLAVSVTVIVLAWAVQQVTGSESALLLLVLASTLAGVVFGLWVNKSSLPYYSNISNLWNDLSCLMSAVVTASLIVSMARSIQINLLFFIAYTTLCFIVSFAVVIVIGVKAKEVSRTG